MTTPTISAPHHAVEVTVVDGIVHRPGAYLADKYTISCDPLETGRSMSAGWAAHLGFPLCEASGCYPPGEVAEDRWWMSSRRRNSHYHRLRPGQAKTDCSKYAGLHDGALDNGMFVRETDVAGLNAKPCRGCWPVTTSA